MTVEADPDSAPPSAARGIAGQVIANTSLLIAVLVYMGWAYDAALYGYFHINPLNLNISIIEYMLVSLSLFKPILAVAVVVLIFLSAGRTWHLDRTKLPRFIGGKGAASVSAADSRNRSISTCPPEQPHVRRALLIRAGTIVTAAAFVLYWIAYYVYISPYVVLAMLCAGPLLLTWPTRADRRGRFPYALAIILTAVCALWAASLYANSLGRRAAEDIVRHLPTRAAVVLYTVRPLALSGPGVYVRTLPAGSLYHYKYQGLRLLTMRSGTFYLLPIHWSPRLSFTYIIDGSSQTRIELY